MDNIFVRPFYDKRGSLLSFRQLLREITVARGDVQYRATCLPSGYVLYLPVKLFVLCFTSGSISQFPPVRLILLNSVGVKKNNEKTGAVDKYSLNPDPGFLVNPGSGSGSQVLTPEH
jgi:hypothetical protein